MSILAIGTAMEATPALANISTKAMLRSCALSGIDTDKLLSDVGIDRRMIELVDGRIPLQQVFALSAEARKRTGDSAFALHAAEALPFGAYGIIDYLAITSSTPREGLIMAARYFGLITTAFNLVPELRNRDALVELRQSNSQALPGHYAEYVLASLLVRFRFTTGVPWRPREVRLSSPTPQDQSEYQRILPRSTSASSVS